MKKIINKFITIYKKLPSSNNWKFWLLIAISIKLIIFIYGIIHPHLNLNYKGTFGIEGGDSYTYFDPIENLIKNGEYADDYRMPGYGWLYFIVRIFFSVNYSLNTIILIQFILSSVSIYFLAKTALLLFKKEINFQLTFFIYCFSKFVSSYDYYLLTESFCVSSLIFSFYFLISSKKSNWNILLSGLFVTWTIFLKPVSAPILLIYSIYLLIIGKNKLWKFQTLNWKMVLIFITPFLLINSTWMIRNYNKYNRVFILTKSLYYPRVEKNYTLPLINFLNAFGGSIVFWEPNHEIVFFVSERLLHYKKINVKLPEYIYTSKFNYDSLVIVKKTISKIEDENLPEKEKEQLEKNVKRMLDKYTLSIKEEKPVLFYLTSRLYVFKTFFSFNSKYNLFFNFPSFKIKFLKFLNNILDWCFYIFIIYLGFLGTIVALYNSRKNLNFGLLACVCLYFALIFPIVLKMDEYRYFVPCFPFFLLAAIYIFVEILSALKKKYYKNKYV